MIIEQPNKPTYFVLLIKPTDNWTEPRLEGIFETKKSAEAAAFQYMQRDGEYLDVAIYEMTIEP